MLRVGARLLLGDAALVDQRLHEGLVVGEHPQVTVAQQVGPGVTDVGERPSGAPSQTRAVSVVPMPSRSGRASTASRSRSLASVTAGAQRGGRVRPQVGAVEAEQSLPPPCGSRPRRQRARPCRRR